MSEGEWNHACDLNCSLEISRGQRSEGVEQGSDEIRVDRDEEYRKREDEQPHVEERQLAVVRQDVLNG